MRWIEYIFFIINLNQCLGDMVSMTLKLMIMMVVVCIKI